MPQKDATEANQRVDSFPDPRSLTSQELKAMLKDLTGRESDVSDTRRVLHAQIDSLRRELVDRLREQGQNVISGADVEGPEATGVADSRCPRPDEARTGSRFGAD